jgi:hypothetical protein
MLRHLSISILTLITVVAFGFSSTLFAGGGKNAYSNPTGDPAEDTYQTPFANTDSGRMLVYCADEEDLVVTPVDGMR